MRPSRSSPPLRVVAVALVAAVVTAAGAIVAAGAPAGAAPPSFDSGSGLPTIANFAPVTLNGTDQLTSASIAPFVVTDDSGLLAGWHVTLLVPTFRNGTGADCSVGATASIAGSNLSMHAPVVTAGDGFTDMTGVAAAGFTDFTSPRPIITASATHGAGVYDVAPAILRLVVPANTLAGAYCSQATIAITSGP